MTTMTHAELNQTVNDAIVAISGQPDAVAFTDAMRGHLVGSAYLRSLSWNNQMLAIMQGATGAVMTFKQWAANGRMVSRGEHSHIELIRPNIARRVDPATGVEREIVTGWSGYKVFDISQTVAVDGSTLPAMFRERDENERVEHARLALETACVNLGIAHADVMEGLDITPLALVAAAYAMDETPAENRPANETDCMVIAIDALLSFLHIENTMPTTLDAYRKLYALDTDSIRESMKFIQILIKRVINAAYADEAVYEYELSVTTEVVGEFKDDVVFAA